MSRDICRCDQQSELSCKAHQWGRTVEENSGQTAAGGCDAMVMQTLLGVVTEEARQGRVSGCQPLGMAPHRLPRADAEAR